MMRLDEHPAHHVFAFDVGLGSLGVCVRKIGSLDPEYLRSYELDATFPSITDKGRGLTKRKRALKQRLFHKARQGWFRYQWETLGLEALHPEDERWGGVKGRKGKYIGHVLLRCALLLGQTSHPDGTPFEDWELYQALWGCVMKRGYGQVDWAKKEEKKSGETRKKKKKGDEESEETEQLSEEDKALLARTAVYTEAMRELLGAEENNPYFQPAFFEAFYSGVWHINTPELLHEMPVHTVEPYRGAGLVCDRSWREKEFKALYQAIQILRPVLQGTTAEAFMYGPTEQKAASYYSQLKNGPPILKGRKLGRFRGSNRVYREQGQGNTPFDWQGLFNQKIPRFDNRILEKCVIFDHLNVCRAKKASEAHPDKAYAQGLVQDVKYLMKLKNLRYPLPHEAMPAKLNAPQLNELWELFVEAKQGALSATWLNKHIQKVDSRFKPVEKEYVKGNFKHFEVDTNDSGRSRFSRPGAAFFKSLVLSGQSPEAFINHCLETGAVPSWKSQEEWIPLADDKTKGITRDQLEALRSRFGGEWENLHIGDIRTMQMEASRNQSEDERVKTIRKRLGKISNPIVRHRLEFYLKQLITLNKEFGEPNHVVLEFVREGLNEHQKSAHEKKIKENETRNKGWANQLEAAGITLKPLYITKLRLWEEQGEHCAYTGRHMTIHQAVSDAYEIDHIIPQRSGGNDKLGNKVLVCQGANRAKGNRTPYEWLSHNTGYGTFEAFEQRVRTMAERDKAKGLSPKKVALLLAKDEEAMKHGKDSYMGLAVTSYVARVAQEITAYYFGRGLQVEGENRFIYVQNGEQTAAIRRKYELNELLHPKEELQDTTQDLDKKLRSNKKHHALDAYVVSLFKEKTEWLEDEHRSEKWRYTSIDECRMKPTLEVHLNHLMPEKVTKDKTRTDFDDTLYGVRPAYDAKGKPVYKVIQRIKWDSGKPEFQPKHIPELLDKAIREDLQARIKAGESFASLKQKGIDGKYLHPIHNNVVRRLMIAVTEIPTSESRATSNVGHNHLGEYLWIDTPKKKMLKKAKESSGYILYKDNKGKHRDHKIRVFASEKEEYAFIQKQGFTIYNPGMQFYSNCKVFIEQEYRKKYTMIRNYETVEGELVLKPFEPFIMRAITGGSVVIETASGLRFNSVARKDKNKVVSDMNPPPLSLDVLCQHGLKLYKGDKST